MRMRMLFPLLLGLLSPVELMASAELTAQVLTQEKTSHTGQPWLTLCWSLDCPACITELKHLAAANKPEWNSRIILINTDADSGRAAERQALLQQLSLTELPSFFFADAMETQSRFLIDPSWYGELPRTYFIDAEGKWHGKSGLVSTEQLAIWLE